ncbi:MAG: hypothetical protein IID40_11385 [Planctomycetes bacterium]|nr:hypothetical protein [Planctomycetota bacterium]
MRPQPPRRAWVALADLGDTRAKDALGDPRPAAGRRRAIRSRARGVMLPSGAGTAEPASESADETGGVGGGAPAASMRAKRDVETDRADADQDVVAATGDRGGGRSDKRSSSRVGGAFKKLVMRVLAPTSAAKESATEPAVGDDRRPPRSAPDKPGRLVQRNLVQLDTERPDRTAPGATDVTPRRMAGSVESAEQFITLVVQFVQPTEAAPPPTREDPVAPPAPANPPDDGGGS